MSTPEDFGIDRYSYVNGVRCRVGVLRTIRPADGETNEEFQARIDALAKELFARHGATDVGTDFELAAGGIVQCVLNVSYLPRPEPQIAPDPRPAGGRVIAMRGARGRQSA